MVCSVKGSVKLRAADVLPSLFSCRSRGGITKITSHRGMHLIVSPPHLEEQAWGRQPSIRAVRYCFGNDGPSLHSLPKNMHSFFRSRIQGAALAEYLFRQRYRGVGTAIRWERLSPLFCGGAVIHPQKATLPKGLWWHKAELALAAPAACRGTHLQKTAQLFLNSEPGKRWVCCIIQGCSDLLSVSLIPSFKIKR